MIKIKPNAFEWVTKEANKAGRDVRDHISYIVELVFASKSGINELAENNANVRLVQYEWEFQEQMRRTKAVYQMAAAYVEHPTESNADKLKDACDIADVDYDAVIQTASNDPFSSYIAEHGTHTKLDEAVLWLRNVFSERTEIPSKDLYIIGNKLGYGEKILRRAKDALCEDLDSPLIEVAKPGPSWIWRLNPDHIGKIQPIEIARKPIATYWMNPYEADAINIIELQHSESVDSGNENPFEEFEDY